MATDRADDALIVGGDYVLLYQRVIVLISRSFRWTVIATDAITVSKKGSDD